MTDQESLKENENYNPAEKPSYDALYVRKSLKFWMKLIKNLKNSLPNQANPIL